MTENHIRMMANQIARNLRTGEKDPAAALARHINDFWDPRMRRDLLGQLAASTEGFEAEVVAAQQEIRPPKS